MSAPTRLLLRFRPGQRFPGISGPYRSTKIRDRALAEYVVAHPECSVAVLNVSKAGNFKVYILSDAHIKEIADAL